MKIALINSEYPLPTGSGQGGIATYTYTMAQALRSLGHIVHVFIRQGTNAAQIHEGIKPYQYGYAAPKSLTQRLINRLRPNPLNWEKGHALFLRNTLVEMHLKKKIDIVEFPEFGGASYYCTQSMPFPVVTTFHMPSSFVDQLNNNFPDKNRVSQYNFEASAIKNASAYRSPSKAMKKEASSLYKISPENITVIPNPVNALLFNSLNRQDHSDTCFHILFTGRLERRKGAEFLQQTIRDILCIDNNINITFAGETNLNDTTGFRHAIEHTLSQDQQKRVCFLGSIGRKELLALYCKSSVLLAPSLFENAPYSILEGMSAKLPVIAAATGGIPEIITHKKTGLLFDITKPSTMISCIKTILDNPQFASEITQNAYNHILHSFSPDKIAKQTISFYESIINQ